MAFLELKESPHAPGHRPVRLYYRWCGSGTPMMLLHGGWGYECYPFERQMEAFGDRYRILIPDRSGYGRSTKVAEDFPLDFHRRAAQEMTAFLDGLGIRQCILWGHSDGAVIAAMMSLATPERFDRLVLEAFHFFRAKSRSRTFFARFAAHPEELGKETRQRLSRDHGDSHWQQVVQRNCGVWLKIGHACAWPGEDLYDGRLGQLTARTLFVHGQEDPRTDAGEMDRVREALPQARFELLRKGQHSPHSEPAAFAQCNAAVNEFLADEGTVGSRKARGIRS